MEKQLTLGSLFSGIGSCCLGFQRAGFDIKWTVEIDPFCRKIIAKNFPEAERFEDVRKVGAANLSSVDVLSGGFPCQDISLAGPGLGLSGARSGLWSEFYRIIGELRPKYVLVENVQALLGRGMHRVLGAQGGSMTDEYQKAIDLLIDTFDFEKVHIYMALTGWTYHDSGEATPTIEDLKKTARGLLAEIANGHSQWAATGGFRVDIYKDPVELTLSFVAVEDSVYV